MVSRFDRNCRLCWARGWVPGLAGVLGLCLLLVGCEGVFQGTCREGDEISCPCPGGETGVKVCGPEGWESCDCVSGGDGGVVVDSSVVDSSVVDGDGSVAEGDGESPLGDGQTTEGDAALEADAAVEIDAADPCAGVDCGAHGVCVVNSGSPVCDCDTGYHAEGLSCVEDPHPCDGVDCSNHGTCLVDSNDNPYCDCDAGYEPQGLFCVESNDPCAGQTCSGHGTCMAWDGEPVCACDSDYTPSSSAGLDCVSTDTVCVGGAINYDYDNDGTVDTWFEPNAWECWMYELVNYTRATHDPEGSPECHFPLMWDVEWAAHGRNHSIQMQNQGGLFHADFPGGQNCAYGCDPPCEMDMYMTGPNEPHCPDLSHHCNIMRCSFSYIGIGYSDSWNTQNFH